MCKKNYCLICNKFLFVSDVFLSFKSVANLINKDVFLYLVTFQYLFYMISSDKRRILKSIVVKMNFSLNLTFFELESIFYFAQIDQF